MPTGTAQPWKPWKILGLLFLVFGLALCVVVTAVVSWVTSFQQPSRNVPVAQHRGPRVSFQSDATLALPKNLNAILADKITNSLAGDDIFKDAIIPTLEIDIPRKGMRDLQNSPREYAQATIREGQITYTNVAIHLKGGPGSYRPLNDKPAFTLNFDKFAPGQTFHGLKKIHLNNSVQDDSYIEEKISRELFEAAGVPTPRAGNAIVNFNGREMGMYVIVEGINKQFLKRYFKNAKGNVYDGHSGTDVNHDLPTNEGDDRENNSRLRALAAAAREPDLNKRLTRLESTLDLDRFLSYMAMEVILWHWDGYTMHQNNFRIFHDRDTDRMVFLPQGMDQMVNKPNGPIFPPTGGIVARAVLEIPEGKRRYRERVAQLTTNILVLENITDRISETSTKIHAALAEHNTDAANQHSHRAASFIRRIQQRARYLQNQVAPAPALQFDEVALAFLTNWEPRLDLGEAQLQQEKDDQGNTLLRIATEDGCTASWRTSRLLNSGTYELQARIKIAGVILDDNDPRAGAGLRISRHRIGQKNIGDKDWTPITFEFDVGEDQTDVELICELRAHKGQVWFDQNSLRLRRK